MHVIQNLYYSVHKNSQCELKGTIAVQNPKAETTAVPSFVAFFLSTDETLDEHDTFLDTVEVGVLHGGETTKVKFHVRGFGSYAATHVEGTGVAPGALCYPAVGGRGSW
jgi:hypothetical protein